VTVENSGDLKQFMHNMSNAPNRVAFLATPLPTVMLMINGSSEDGTLSMDDTKDIFSHVQRFLRTKTSMERKLIRLRTDAAIIGLFLATYVERFGKAEQKMQKGTRGLLAAHLNQKSTSENLPVSDKDICNLLAWGRAAFIYPDIVSRGGELFCFIFENGHMDRYKKLTEDLIVALEVVSTSTIVDRYETSLMFI